MLPVYYRQQLKHQFSKIPNKARVFFGALLFCISLNLSWSANAQQVSFIEALNAGQSALVAGDLAYAEEVASFIVEVYPEHIQGYLFLSSVHVVKGNNLASLSAAKHAFQLAKTDEQKYHSSLAIGLAQANRNRLLLAEYWLRKSFNNTEHPRQVTLAADLLNEVRRKSPFRLSLSFGVTPSTNINGGSLANKVLINNLEFTLDPNAKPVKGLGFNYALGLSYQKQIDPDVTFLWSANTAGVIYKIKPTAEQKKIGVKGSNFNSHQISTRMGFAFGDGVENVLLRQTVFLAELSQDWYGQEVLAKTIGIIGRKAILLNDSSRLSFSLEFEKRFREDLKERSSTAQLGNIVYEKSIRNGDFLTAVVSGSSRSSASAEIANKKIGLHASYRFRPINKAFQPEFFLGYEKVSFNKPFLTSQRRKDDKVTLGVNVKLLKLSYFGFNPTLGYTFQNVSSNIDLHNSRSHIFKVGLESLF